MSTPEDRYRRAQAIAHELLERPVAERAERLSSACGDDEALCREVQWLIAAVETGETSAGPLEQFEDLTHSLLANVRIDANASRHYTLIERLGEGGMGQVWLAEREDGAVRQRVALKLLRGATPSGSELSRFIAEGRILASLSHPNIAHLIDAGSGSDGMPFLAMEHVDGERLDRWCSQRDLPLRTRIELFIKVCTAVEYAHARLIIHRDLKPTNILVNRDGEPKLLDFGIARLLDADVGGNATTELSAMTMAYASPEQVRAEPLGTATDIYSLGVVLYELVAGVRPFDHITTEHDRSNAIISGEIVPPSRNSRMRSTTTSPERAAATPQRRIPADIDAIVLKALRREPAQRYASVREFADDLRRFLSARPVLARRGQRMYRVQRFVQRNRWPLAAAAALLAIGTAFVVERERQLRRIEIERDRAAAIAKFTGNLFDSAGALPSRGEAVTVRQMLDRGAADLQKRSGLPDDIRASLLLTMGSAYNSLGLDKPALPLLQSAQELLRGGTPLQQADVNVAIGRALFLGGRHPESIRVHNEAIAQLRTLSGDNSDRIDALRIEVARMHVDLVDVPLEQSMRELEAIAAALDAAPQRPDQLRLSAYTALAQGYSVAKNSARSVRAAERASELSNRLYGASDIRATKDRMNLAWAVRDQDPERAVSLIEEVLAGYERSSRTPSIAKAVIQYNLAKALRYAGRLPDAARVLEEACPVVQSLGGAQHRLLLAMLDELAVIYNQAGEPAKTRELLGRTLPDFAEAARTGGVAEQDCHAMALAALGEAERLSRRYDEAAKYFAQADAILAKLDLDGFREDVLDLLEWTAALHLDRGDASAARATLDRFDDIASHPTAPPPQRVAASRALRTRLAGIALAATHAERP